MFILTNISVEHNTVAIFDTTDGTNEAINLTTIADDVVKGKLRVYGIWFTNEYINHVILSLI